MSFFLEVKQLSLSKGHITTVRRDARLSLLMEFGEAETYMTIEGR